MSVFWLKCFKTIINYLKEIKEIKYVKIELNFDIHVLCKKKKKQVSCQSVTFIPNHSNKK